MREDEHLLADDRLWSCLTCMQCSQVCPASLPVHRLGRIRSDECHACVECVRSCPAPGALELRLPALVPEPQRRLSPARLAVAVLLLASPAAARPEASPGVSCRHGSRVCVTPSAVTDDVKNPTMCSSVTTGRIFFGSLLLTQ